MIEIITSAGMNAPEEKPADPRREMIKSIRNVLRRADATEDEDVDALEALIEMTKE